MTGPLSDQFIFWVPPSGFTVQVGPERREVVLPQIELPVRIDRDPSELPESDAIGTGLYDYLRQFPDCPYNKDYAKILRDAYPHYLSDLGAQILMLDHKDVDAPYMKRKIVSMQILSLLDESNRGLKLQIGLSLYDLALMYPELPRCRHHLARAMQYLSAAGDNAATLNALARIDYLIGDYPKAIQRWRRVAKLVDDPTLQSAINDQVAALVAADEPGKPLIDDLEDIGKAMVMIADDRIDEARAILERLDEENIVPRDFPNPEFYYMLGICRERSGDAAGAFAAFQAALEIDPEHEPSREGLDRISGGNQ